MNTKPFLSEELWQELQTEALQPLVGLLNNPDALPTIVVNLSGGLDSVAALLLCKKHFPNHHIIAHHQAIAEDWYSAIAYNRDLCRRLNIPLFVHQAIYIYTLRLLRDGRAKYEWQMRLVEIPPERDHPYTREEGAKMFGDIDPALVAAGILDMAEARGMGPSKSNRWCTAFFKTQVFDKWCRMNRSYLGPNVISIIGYRRAESSSRAKQPIARVRDISLKPCPDYPNGWQCYDLHPILDWGKAETWRYLVDHGIEPHGAYKAQGIDPANIQEGGPRMSCVQCIFVQGCHAVRAVQPNSSVSPEDTAYAQQIFRRTLRFQREHGWAWQQSGPDGFNSVADVLGEPHYHGKC